MNLELISFHVNRTIVGAWLFSLCCLNMSSAFAQPADENNQNDKLRHVQQAISKQKSNIKEVSSKRTKLEKQLKNDDLAIAKIVKAMTQTQKDHQQTQKTLKKLAQQKKQLSNKKHQQEKILSQQLRAAYTSGHHDYLKLLLNQEKPATVQRTMSYYQYLNSARIQEIDQFQQVLSQLLEVTTEHQAQAQQLAHLKQQQSTQKVTFESNKAERKKTITALNKELLSNQEQLDKLIAEEDNLVAALQRITQLAQQEINLAGLNKLKKKLSWPVNGKVSHSFGSRKQGYLKWKGVLMSAPVGRQVKTIHNGTVLFSDWLKGYGLVTVIDHGQGYMSLYGHNQALLKSVGDRVETGEPIALVGQSGGQSESGLYFEIRYHGKAVNPKKWCK